ncbi:MAG: SDR family NAD(P)-dependent oxidoreductase [Acidobacteriota bacterium]
MMSRPFSFTLGGNVIRNLMGSFSLSDTVGKQARKSLSGKTAFITGATGNLGSEVAKELARRGARLILHYNSRVRKALELELALKMLGTEVTMLQSDFTQPSDLKELIDTVCSQTDHIDYLIHAAGVCRLTVGHSEIAPEELNRIHRINQLAPIEIMLGLEEKLSSGSVVLYVGSPVEDAYFDGTLLYGESKRGLHHFAARYAESLQSRGTSSVYYIPGIMRESIPHIFYGKYSTEEMSLLGQPCLLEPGNVARNVVSTLLSRPLGDVWDQQDGPLLVRRDGYTRQPIAEC